MIDNDYLKIYDYITLAVKFILIILFFTSFSNCSNVSIQENKLEQLTDIEGDEIWAQASPNSKQIVFQHSNNGNIDILLLNIETKKITELVASKENESTPSWSPDGKEIIYTTSKKGTSGLWKINLKTKEKKKIFFEDSLKLSAPSWSPDGRYISATGLYKNKYYQWILDLETQKIDKLTEGGDEFIGKWSTDGKEIIYHTGKKDSLISINVASRKKTYLSKDKYGGWSPEIAPDNNHFSFTTDIGGSLNIWTGNKGTTVINKITDREHNDYPSWFLNGKAILFSRKILDEQLYKLNVLTNRLTQLTLGENNSIRPKVSKSGKIAYVSVNKLSNNHHLSIFKSGMGKRVGESFTAIENIEWSYDEQSLIVAASKAKIFNVDSINLYQINLRTDKTKLLPNTKSAKNPIWLDKTPSIIYSAKNYSDNTDNLWKYNTRTNEKTLVLDGKYDLYATDHSEKESSILFHERVNWGEYIVYEYNLITKEKKLLLKNEKTAREAKWNTDQTKITYLTNLSRQFDINYWDTISNQTVQLTSTIYRESPPDWLNDQEIIFSVNANDMNLWQIKLDN